MHNTSNGSLIIRRHLETGLSDDKLMTNPARSTIIGITYFEWEKLVKVDISLIYWNWETLSIFAN